MGVIWADFMTASIMHIQDMGGGVAVILRGPTVMVHNYFCNTNSQAESFHDGAPTAGPSSTSGLDTEYE